MKKKLLKMRIKYSKLTFFFQIQNKEVKKKKMEKSESGEWQ